MRWYPNLFLFFSAAVISIESTPRPRTFGEEMARLTTPPGLSNPALLLLFGVDVDPTEESSESRVIVSGSMWLYIGPSCCDGAPYWSAAR